MQRPWLRIKRQNTLTSQITGLVGSLFIDSKPVVLGYLMRVVDRWAEIVGKDTDRQPLVPCSIHFPESTKQQGDQEKWEAGMEAMDEILQMFGAHSGWDGFVSYADYEGLREDEALCY
ncbi:hypothetical protein MPDQ_005966 [Monascus purpureus]|uniref:Uncharacterized protein n=1 Tax=Monascus purpureus TaxID=5098 RepID=A0A507QZD9_MONPU|nr:hypothetical protein MPDQ_005966 [Monascus purpureus]